MNRREAVSAVALLMGGALINMETLLTGCKTGSSNGGGPLSNDDVALLDEIGETIVPTTSTPGAKAAQTGLYIAAVVKDCYDEKHRNAFIAGMDTFRSECKKRTGKTFMDNNAEHRLAFLNALDAEQKAYTKDERNKDKPHYFRMMKELTLYGYFTSQPGATQTLRYIETPGRYDGCVDYKKGDKVWATG